MRLKVDICKPAIGAKVDLDRDTVIGKSQAEGRATLARFLEWTVQPAFTYRHNWSAGDCVIWENTSALHRVLPYAQDSGRMMHRTTVGGVEQIQ